MTGRARFLGGKHLGSLSSLWLYDVDGLETKVGGTAPWGALCEERGRVR